MTTNYLSTLTELNEKRTQGEWKYDGWGYLWGPNMEMIADTDDEEAYLARMRGVGGNLPIQENMEFITALVNSFHQMKAEILAGRALAEAVRGMDVINMPCDCYECLPLRMDINSLNSEALKQYEDKLKEI